MNKKLKIFITEESNPLVMRKTQVLLLPLKQNQKKLKDKIVRKAYNHHYFQLHFILLHNKKKKMKINRAKV